MRHYRASSSISCFCDLLYFLLTLLLLLTNASYFVSGNDEENGAGTAGYCRLCERHTMCLFPFDDVASKCIDVENGDLDPEEVRSLVHQHNVQRNNIARGQETRGNPGPQPSARNMMELTWDDELAQLARKWALQCNTDRRDYCRDVERFEVWQNVHVLYLDDIMDSGIVEGQHQAGIEEDANTTTSSSSTAFMRIRFHVQSWLNEVDHFDSSRVGLVDFAVENETSYVAIAGAKITRLGCGRAMYSVDLDESAGEVEVGEAEVAAVAIPEAAEATSNKNDTGTGRVEVLVCNYGPIDRTTPQNLYEVGALEDCPEGSVPSNEYDHLCTTTEDLRELSPRDSEDRNVEDGEASLDPSWHDGIVGSPRWEEERRSSSTSSAISIALRKCTGASGRSSSLYVLAEFLSLVLLHIITKTPGARCC